MNLESVVAEAVDNGDFARAFVAYTHMVRRAMDTRRWAFLEVARLARMYRGEDARSRAQVLSRRGVEPGEMLGELARLEFVFGNWERADQFADLSSTPHGEHVRGMVAANMGRIPWGQVPAGRACWRAGISLVELVTAGKPIPASLGPSIFARTLTTEFSPEDPDDRRHCIASYCALGRADDAWRAAMSLLPDFRHLLALSHRPITRGLALAESLLAERPAESIEVLDGLTPRLEPLTGLHSQQAVLIRAIACSFLGDRRGFYTTLTMLRYADVAPRHWGVLDGLTLPPWSRARLVELGAPLPNALPTRPVAMGNFVASEPVGSGGMGEVWRGEHAALGVPVAIKVIRLGVADGVQDFEAEIDAVSRLDHPAIVQVLDVGRLGPAAERQTGGQLRSGTPFLVMELASGTLVSHCGRLDWGKVRDILLALLDALAYAHARGVVHRDIKPANILTVATPEGLEIRLSDFGLVGLDGGRVRGTPAYLAPEVWATGRFGPASDLYAVGCLAVCLLTGMPPFLADSTGLSVAHQTRTPALDVPEIPKAARSWIAGLLEKHPAQRPTVLDARAALRCINVSPLPPRRSVTAPCESRSTFVLEGLLDGPVPRGRASKGLYRGRELPADWRGSRPARRRLPSARLWARGDPPVLGRESVQDRLWVLLRGAIASGQPARVCLVGPTGVGRRSLARWLAWRAAELSGQCSLSIGEAPTSAPAVIDAVGLPPEVVAPWLRGPVLAIWTQRGPPDVEAIELRPMDPAMLAAVVLERVPLEFPSLLRLADVNQTLGRPGLALAHLEAAVPFSRPVLGRAHLRIRRSAPGVPAQARAWWERTLIEDVDPDVRAALEVVAVLGAVLPGDLHRITGDSSDLTLCADWLAGDGPFRLPRAARTVLLGHLGPRARDLHRQAMESLDDPVRRECHRAFVDPMGADLDLLVQDARARRWFQNPWSPQVAEAGRRVMTARLLSTRDPRLAPIDLLDLEMSRDRRSATHSIALLRGFIQRWRGVDAFHVALAANKLARQVWGRLLPEAAETIAEAVTLSRGFPECELVARSSQVFQALKDNRVAYASALVADCALADDARGGEGRIFWIQAQAEMLPPREAAVLIQEAVAGFSGGAEAILHRDLGVFLGRSGDVEGAAHHSALALESAFGLSRVSMLANLAICHALLGRRSEAAAVAMSGAQEAEAWSSPLLGFFHRLMLASRTDWAGRSWEAMWSVCPVCEDESDIAEMLDLGVAWAKEQGQLSRAAVLQAEADRIRRALP